jgi:acid phosphatase
MKFKALKAATAALIVVPIATPAALNLLQSSSAASSSGAVTNYTTAQQAGCPSSSSATPNSASDSRWYGKGGNTTYDARGTTFTQTDQNLYPVWLEGANNCFQGATIQGTISKSEQWYQLKKCCNGAGIMVDGATKLLGVREDDISNDAVRIRNHAATTIDEMYASYTRDDCISDITHADLIVNDSLFDGCHTGISWRSHNSKIINQPFTLQVTNSLFYIQPMATGGGGGSCKDQIVNGEGNGPMWKMEGNAERVDLHNVIIRQDLGNHECGEVWPQGTYDNVTFVWTNSKPYPGKLPAGVKVTKDVSVWNTAKSAWLDRHSGSGGTPSPDPTTPPPSQDPTPTPDPTTPPPSQDPTPTPDPTTPPPSSGSIDKVLMIVEENHNAPEARSSMPYLMSQAKTYGEARNYNALADKSLPNYLALAGGSMFGINADVEPSDQTIHGDSLFSQLAKAGKSSEAYMETMPFNCDPNKNDDPYSNHHNAWLYFNDDQANCKKLDVPLGTTSGGALASDIRNGLPTFSLAVPDKNNDSHDGSLGQADNWLKAWLPAIEAGPDYKAGRLAIVVTFDEGADGTGSRLVETVVISPYTHNVVSNTAYDHYSMLRTLSDIFGVAPLRNASSAKSMRGEFHI